MYGISNPFERCIGSESEVVVGAVLFRVASEEL